MKTSIVDGYVPYTISFAEAVTVTHNERFVFSYAEGRELYAFIHVLQGKMEYSFLESGEKLSVEQDGAIYIPKGCRYYSTYLSRETKAVIFEFDLHAVSPELPPQNAMLMPPDTGRLFRSSDQYALFDCIRCAARIYDLLAVLRQAEVPMPKKYRRLLPAIEELERDPATVLPVSHYAEMCGMSEPGFRRSFREYIGQSPVEYRNSLRLVHARKLIASGEYSVEEAAAQSGFSNLSFFYRLFRRKFGRKPGSL